MTDVMRLEAAWDRIDRWQPAVLSESERRPMLPALALAEAHV